MNPNYPAGFTQGEHERIFGGERDGRISADICPGCKLEIEERYRDLFYVDDRRCEPIDTPEGPMCCSQQCLSQSTFKSLCPHDQAALRDLARAAYAWFIGTDSGQLKWKLQPAGIANVIPAALFGDAEMAMGALLKQLAGEDFISGESDGPEWFQYAVGLLRDPLPFKPQSQGVQMVKQGMGVLA
jgi:hypothetical protein